MKPTDPVYKHCTMCASFSNTACNVTLTLTLIVNYRNHSIKYLISWLIKKPTKCIDVGSKHIYDWKAE